MEEHVYEARQRSKDRREGKLVKKRDDKDGPIAPLPIVKTKAPTTEQEEDMINFKEVKLDFTKYKKND